MSSKKYTLKQKREAFDKMCIKCCWKNPLKFTPASFEKHFSKAFKECKLSAGGIDLYLTYLEALEGK
jgi:hypothetical protein